jgi:flagellar hook-length control protein FliK
MTGMITPAVAPAAPAAGRPAPQIDGAEPAPPFGPALARAREQVSRRPSERTSSSADEAGEPTSDASPSTDDKAARSNSNHNDTSTEETATRDPSESAAPSDGAESDAEGSDAEGSDTALSNTALSNTALSNTGSSDPGPADAAESGGAELDPASSDIASSGSALSDNAMEEAVSSETTVPATAEQNRNAAGASVISPPAAHDHPTAKGAVGDGGPSTTPTVEGAAPPAPSSAIPIPGSTAVTPADVETVVGTAVQQGSGNDATAVSSDSGNGSGLGANSLQLTADGAIQHAAAQAAAAVGPNRPGRTGVESIATVPDAVALSPVDGTPLSPTDAPASGSPTEEMLVGSASGKPATADGADGLVVLAREAGRGADAVRPSAATTPTPGPLTTAEGSLWEDVRMAFDRIRSTGNGQEVRIRLRPADLGELVVQVRTQGEQVAVRLTASSQAAQQALVDDRLRLAAELARAGFEEGSVDIGRDEGGNLGQPGQGTDGERGRERLGPAPIPAAVERSLLERRDPIRTDSGVRPGRHAYSTINLTL